VQAASTRRVLEAAVTCVGAVVRRCNRASPSPFSGRGRGGLSLTTGANDGTSLDERSSADTSLDSGCQLSGTQAISRGGIAPKQIVDLFCNVVAVLGTPRPTGGNF